MISSHPYNTWPLHVKLFTDEAAKAWTAITKKSSAKFAAPQGFTCTTELEGMDGCSGQKGSGREGPIDVKDGGLGRLLSSSIITLIAYLHSELFTLTHMRKASAVVSPACSICHEPIHDFKTVSRFLP